LRGAREKKNEGLSPSPPPDAPLFSAQSHKNPLPHTKDASYTYYPHRKQAIRTFGAIQNHPMRRAALYLYPLSYSGTAARPASLLSKLDALRQRQWARIDAESGSIDADGARAGGVAGAVRTAATTASGGGDDDDDKATPPSSSPSSAWTVSRAFTQSDVDAFVALTGDANPIHRQAEGGGTSGRRSEGAAVAAATAPPPPPPLVPGLLLASLFPGIIGSRFSGALYARQTLRFRAPARVGEAVVAEVSVAEAGRGAGSGGGDRSSAAPPSSSRVVFDTVVRRVGDGRVLVDGTALAIIPLEVQRGRT